MVELVLLLRDTNNNMVVRRPLKSDRKIIMHGIENILSKQ